MSDRSIPLDSDLEAAIRAWNNDDQSFVDQLEHLREELDGPVRECEDDDVQHYISSIELWRKIRNRSAHEVAIQVSEAYADAQRNKTPRMDVINVPNEEHAAALNVVGESS